MPISMSSKEGCLTNMRDAHTCPIGGVNLVGAGVDIASVKLAQLTRQVISGLSVHAPVGINISLRLPLLGLGRRTVSHSSLTSIVTSVLAVIAEAKKAALEAAMALGSNMALTAT